MEPLNTSKDFHKCGLVYAFTFWALFAVYCIYYQIQTYCIWLHRRSNDKSKKKRIPSIHAYVPRFLNRVVKIPFITEFIEVKHIIGLFLFMGLNVVFIIFSPFQVEAGSTWTLQSVGLMDRRAAYVGMVNWSFVFVLGTRNTVVTRMSGLTFESLIPFHRWIARIGWCEFMTHFVWRIMRGYEKSGTARGALFLDIEQGTGTVAMIGFFILFITSFEWIRRRIFWFFYVCHIVGIIVAIIASCWHEVGCFYYFIPAVLLWFFDRVWRSFQSWCIRTETLRTEVHGEVVAIDFKYDLLSHYRPGQYVFVSMVDRAKNALWQYTQWHPFTISAASRSKKEASVHIKALGDKTKAIAQALRDQRRMNIRVDGMYGPRLMYQDHPTILLFAAGIGITPALTLITDCVNKRSAGARGIVTERVHLVWAVRQINEVEPFMETIVGWYTSCQEAAFPIKIYLDLYVTQSKETVKDHWLYGFQECTITYGRRPDIGQCMEEIQTKLSDADDVWVHTCGSNQFMSQVINEAVKRHWHHHHETFEF